MWDGQSLGHGIGLRVAHFDYLLEHGPHDVDWFEVISENFVEMAGRPWAVLQKVRAEVPIVMHGVSMAIGNTDPLDMDYLHKLKALKEAIDPAWISDHICWGGFGGHNAHDLLPLPYTEETLAHLVPRIQKVQEFLGREMTFENVSSYITFQENEMEEWEFVTALAKRTGCKLLVDVNNIFVSGYNHQFDPQTFINAIDPSYVRQFHVAGHTDKDGYKLDTHLGPTPPGVWEVYRMAVRRFGRVSTLIEWDEDVPAYDVVVAESQLARQIEKEILDGADQSDQASAEVLDLHQRSEWFGERASQDQGERP